MIAECQNAVPNSATLPRTWHRCGWSGEVESLDAECPNCLRKGTLAPVVMVPKPTARLQS